MTGQSIQNTDKYNNLKKGLSMKYKHFDNIEPNHRTDFIMLYFAACRTLNKLETDIRRQQNGMLTATQFRCLNLIHRKMTQMAALWKNKLVNPHQ